MQQKPKAAEIQIAALPSAQRKAIAVYTLLFLSNLIKAGG